jgi:hypothetical protein
MMRLRKPNSILNIKGKNPLLGPDSPQTVKLLDWKNNITAKRKRTIPLM